MFVIFINDMPEVVESSIKLFADDAKIYRALKTPEEDMKALQQDLDALEEWTATWQMAFNASKCRVLHLGRNNNKANYSLSGITLNAADEVRDLGVVVTNDLSQQSNTQVKVKKANQILGMLRRSFTHLDSKTLCLLYKALVRPHLEYCNAITKPTTERDMLLLESVQRRATKQIASLREQPYEVRLQHLKLPSMRYRLLRGDLIQLFIYCHQNIDSKPRSISCNNNVTRGHSQKLEKMRCRTSMRLRSFPHRAIDIWNQLPEEVVSAPSINGFKTRVDKHLSHLS
jgi:hypothetical protein